MRRNGFWGYATLAAIVLLSSAAVLAQGGVAYNPANETTIKGTVTGVSTIMSKTIWGGLHAIVSTDHGPVDVHLGSVKFLADNKLDIAKGDQIEVTGVMAKFIDGDAMMAREVTKNGHKLTLRDAKGLPLWPGARRW
jgi:hypothetical protein